MTGPRTLSVGDLIGSLVVSARGRHLGHVVDLVVQPARGYEVTHLEIGRNAWLDRYDIVRGPARSLRIGRRARRIPWSDVAGFDGATVTLFAEKSRRS